MNGWADEPQPYKWGKMGKAMTEEEKLAAQEIQEVASNPWVTYEVWDAIAGQLTDSE